MKIMELIGTPYKYFQASKTAKAWKWAFQTSSGVLYTVVVEMNKPWLAEIGFSARAPGEGKFTTAATGTGDAFKVMNTIKSIVQDFVVAYTKQFGKPPRIISFSGAADEPTRLKLYDKLASKPQDWLPDSKWSYKLHRTAEKDGYKVYVLVRTDLLD